MAKLLKKKDSGKHGRYAHQKPSAQRGKKNADIAKRRRQSGGK